MTINGLLSILKPPGMTSHDVVSFVRRTYGLKKVGHAGTLDPAAAGVLPVALGNGTRVLEYMTDCDKSYRVELTIGFETDTGDDTGTVLRQEAAIMPSRIQMEEVLTSFLGDSLQVPPMYSAIKIQGQKLYDLARAGITVERAARPITISSIQLLKLDETRMLFDVTCSKGTYIRSLCTDIGQKIGYPVTMSFLVRTRVGQFALAAAASLEEIAASPLEKLLPPDHALAHLPALFCSDREAAGFLHGRSLPNSNAYPDQQLVRLYDPSKTFIGIAQAEASTNQLAPVKVFKPE